MKSGEVARSVRALWIRHPGGGRAANSVDVLGFALLVTVLTAVLAHNTAALGYRWQWHRVPRYLLLFEDGSVRAGPLLLGLGVTLRIVAISLGLATIIALITALLRLSRSAVGRSVAKIYLEVVRNTPLIVQLFFTYFVIAPIIGMQSWTAAVLSLSLFEGAYASEIIRGSIVSLPQGQWEASYSLGLGRRDALRFVILPQAVRRVLPPLVGQGISLIKDSALVSTIAIYDLTMRGQVIVSQSFLAFEIWFVIAAMYLVLTLSLSAAVTWLRRRLGSAYER